MTLKDRVDRLERLINTNDDRTKVSLISPNGKNTIELWAGNEAAGVYVKTPKHISSLLNMDNETQGQFSGLFCYRTDRLDRPSLGIYLDNNGCPMVQAKNGVDVVSSMELHIIIQAFQTALVKEEDNKEKPHLFEMK